MEVVIWQTIVSPHMSDLAVALASQGASVTYIAGGSMSTDRRSLGWHAPEMSGVKLEMQAGQDHCEALIDQQARGAIHITQGLRRNGYISHVIKHLKKTGRRWGVLLETVDDRGAKGLLKRLDYSLAFVTGRAPDFALAIGENTSSWIAERGFPRNAIFPFCYFFDVVARNAPVVSESTPFRFGFIGQFVARKNLTVLIDSLVEIGNADSFQLVVIGRGPLENVWREECMRKIGHKRLEWRGGLSMTETRAAISELDCVVLPSQHDGWGAVIGESLMCGVPSICSDKCGASAVVRASGHGGVFPLSNPSDLVSLLRAQLAVGKLAMNDRQKLARWASCLNGASGAAYLRKILQSVYQGTAPPPPPWHTVRSGLSGPTEPTQH